VSEYNEGNVELAKIWFQRAWESLESDGGKATAKTQAFRHELEQAPPAKPAKVQFPEGYKVDVYYRDGWYIQPKNSDFGEKALPQVTAEQSEQVYSFLPGSTYKIRLQIEDEHSEAVHEVNARSHKEINLVMKFITALVMMSWVIAR
jgi:hypothetical protein